MDKHQFYTNLNTAKLQFVELRKEASLGKSYESVAYKEFLLPQIKETINLLVASLPFFKELGKKCEVDVLIVGYKSLQAMLNST